MGPATTEAERQDPVASLGTLGGAGDCLRPPRTKMQSKGLGQEKCGSCWPRLHAQYPLHGLVWWAHRRIRGE